MPHSLCVYGLGVFGLHRYIAGLLVPLVLVGMNAVYALSAWPAGVLSDRMSRPTMLMAGLAALAGGFLALINPVSASVATATLAGWALLIVAVVQGWGAWKAEQRRPRIRAGLIAAVSAFLGLSLLHRYKNSRSNSPMAPLFALLSEEEMRDAEVLGKAMRFGAMFSVKDPAEAGTLKVLPKKGQLELRLTKIGSALMGEVAEARFRALASALGLEPVVTQD